MIFWCQQTWWILLSLSLYVMMPANGTFLTCLPVALRNIFWCITSHPSWFCYLIYLCDTSQWSLHTASQRDLSSSTTCAPCDLPTLYIFWILKHLHPWTTSSTTYLHFYELIPHLHVYIQFSRWGYVNLVTIDCHEDLSRTSEPCVCHWSVLD